MVPENTKINIINNIKTSMEMENQNLSANDISLLNDFADNKIFNGRCNAIYKTIL